MFDWRSDVKVRRSSVFNSFLSHFLLSSQAQFSSPLSFCPFYPVTLFIAFLISDTCALKMLQLQSETISEPYPLSKYVFLQISPQNQPLKSISPHHLIYSSLLWPEFYHFLRGTLLTVAPIMQHLLLSCSLTLTNIIWVFPPWVQLSQSSLVKESTLESNFTVSDLGGK